MVRKYTKEEELKLIERFIKDNSLSIDYSLKNIEILEKKIKQYEYFVPGVFNKYLNFKNEITSKYERLEDYYTDRNQIIKKIIEDQELLQKQYDLNSNDYTFTNKSIKKGDVYKDEFVGKKMVSIDLKSANFQALRYHNPEIIRNKETYYDYISLFTDFEHIRESKYLRTTILGRTNIKAIHKIEMFMINELLEIILEFIDISNIYSLNSDEIIFSKTEEIDKILEKVNEFSKNQKIKLSIDFFEIKRIEENKKGFLKIIENGEIKIKTLNCFYIPFVIAKLKNEKVDDDFLYFNKDGFLAKLEEEPY